jgi:hypothetical protein
MAGFVRRTRDVVGCARAIAAGVATMDGLFLMGPNQAMIVCFGAREVCARGEEGGGGLEVCEGGGVRARLVFDLKPHSAYLISPRRLVLHASSSS